MSFRGRRVAIQKTSFALGLLVGLSPLGWAADGPGTSGSPFLKIPISGRAAAMGGAFGAVTNDISSLDYNPAAINGINRIDMMATYSRYFEETSLQAGSIGIPIRLKTSNREPLSNAEFDQSRALFGFQYRQFKAEDTARSALLGVEGDDFDIRSQLIQAALAYPVTPRVGFGASAKLITDKVETKTAKSKALDLGLVAKLNSYWTAGAAIQNLGTSEAFETEKDPLPRQARASLAYKGWRWMGAADATFGGDGQLRSAAGLEWTIGSILKLRGGAVHETDLQFTGGIGLQIHGPQKVGEPFGRRPPSSQKSIKTLSEVARSMIQQSADKLRATAEKSGLLTTPTTLAIYPLTASDTSGVAVADGLTTVFKGFQEYQILPHGERDRSETMLVGKVETTSDTYLFSVRLIFADTADTIATDRFELAKEDLYNISKPTLGTEQPSVNTAKNSMGFSTLDLGLDYGLASHKELGVTHTFSLKLLY